MTRYFAVSAALILVGCTHEQETIATAPIVPPPPPPVYFKQGASNEDFQRAKARCFANAHTTANVLDDPDRWMFVYQQCMRSDGWVLASKR